MGHAKRGLAIIFNHEFFTVSHLKPRSGTNVDCEQLVNTLKDLGFEVKDFHNATHRDIVKNLEAGKFFLYSFPLTNQNIHYNSHSMMFGY